VWSHPEKWLASRRRIGDKPPGQQWLTYALDARTGAEIWEYHWGWTNAASQAHTATSADGGWHTGEIAPGQTAAVTVDQPGTFTYLYWPHPWMIGQIIVDARR
jgi:outer membrane protein assembly factor BamB